MQAARQGSILKVAPMTEIQAQLARARITDLRIRVAKITDVLRDALAATQDIEEPGNARLQGSIRALLSVSAEFESLCDEQLSDLQNVGNRRSAEARARSEVESGEFDSQS